MQTFENQRRLVVEGIDDLYSVVGIMRAHIDWPDDRAKAPVYIDIGRSVDEILSPLYLGVLLKSPTIRMLGIIIDANSRPGARYGRLRELCRKSFPDIPEGLPPEGLVVEGGDGRTLGAWIMPNNLSTGALEDLLIAAIPDAGKPILEHAKATVEAAQRKGAPFRSAHIEKARLYTWLALQDPPSQNPRRALYSKALDPTSHSVRPFVAWFRRLYRL
jgi:hypothetical protein